MVPEEDLKSRANHLIQRNNHKIVHSLIPTLVPTIGNIVLVRVLFSAFYIDIREQFSARNHTRQQCVLLQRASRVAASRLLHKPLLIERMSLLEARQA
jgi:hypothetical protein